MNSNRVSIRNLDVNTAYSMRLVARELPEVGTILKLLSAYIRSRLRLDRDWRNFFDHTRFVVLLAETIVI